VKEKSNGLNLRHYWPFWTLNFSFHIIIGLAVSMAGTVVIFTFGEVLNGLAMVGAGSFAIINGCQGFMELAERKVNKRYITSKGNHW